MGLCEQNPLLSVLSLANVLFRIDYLANCNGPCEKVDKTTLEFFKIDGVGLVSDNPSPGTWASDELISNNQSWVVKIPETLAAGNYVLRHEIIALHSAEEAGGAQFYPHCVNLAITGTGTSKPSGTLGTALYKESDPGVLVNIYTSLASYDVPGPSPIAGAVAISSQYQPSITANGVVETGTAAPAAAVAQSSSAAAPIVPVSSSAAAPATSAAASSSSAVTSAPAAPAASSTLATAISGAASSALGLTSALPSELLTSVLPTAVPTGAASGSVPAPSKPLPEGTTLEDLLEWMSYIFQTMFKTLEGEQKNHARDFAH